ncbi:MAG: ogr/Delta-like zinc finger family protein [Thermomonas hydrothermalis]|uniref:ogr/Delta-like zinc finger family protein n=1 Tax=Thermomonas hydrothermalis TaxID=213588 RepID=UPI00235419C1|nr:ogr/Delta-like zinc finger family protein [Thermomonas hydrothermalis]MCL6619953.1 ogr/Delta-like zinc finger family protein [Thermomonas hydrothermalis]
MSRFLDALIEHLGGGLVRQRGQRWGRCCPHCGAPSRIRSSRQETPIYSEVLRVCQNPLCGHVWLDAVEALRTLSPSAIPNPDVRLLPSRHIRPDVVAQSIRSDDLFK